MKVTDAWNVLFGTDTDARIVIKTDGAEVDVVNIQQFAQLVVITPAEELTDAARAESDLYAAQVEIDELKREVLELTRALDEARSEE